LVAHIMGASNSTAVPLATYLPSVDDILSPGSLSLPPHDARAVVTQLHATARRQRLRGPANDANNTAPTSGSGESHGDWSFVVPSPPAPVLPLCLERGSGGLIYGLDHSRRRLQLEGAGSDGGGLGLPSGMCVAKQLELLILCGVLGCEGASADLQAAVPSRVLAEATELAELRPKPHAHVVAALALALHRKLGGLRGRGSAAQPQGDGCDESVAAGELGSWDALARAAEAIASAPAASAKASAGEFLEEGASLASDPRITAARPACSPGGGGSRGPAAQLPLSVAIGVRLFFKLLRSLQRSGHVHGLLTLARQLPRLLAPMPPRALVAPSRPLAVLCRPGPASGHPAWVVVAADCGDGPGDGSGGGGLEGTSLAVVEALWGAVEELAALDDGLLGPSNHADALAALVALAVKRSDLRPLLSAARLLIFGPSFATPLGATVAPGTAGDEGLVEDINEKDAKGLPGKLSVKRYAVSRQTEAHSVAHAEVSAEVSAEAVVDSKAAEESPADAEFKDDEDVFSRDDQGAPASSISSSTSQAGRADPTPSPGASVDLGSQTGSQTGSKVGRDVGSTVDSTARSTLGPSAEAPLAVGLALAELSAGVASADRLPWLAWGDGADGDALHATIASPFAWGNLSAIPTAPLVPPGGQAKGAGLDARAAAAAGGVWSGGGWSWPGSGGGFLLTFGKGDHGKLGHGWDEPEEVLAPSSSGVGEGEEQKASCANHDCPMPVAALGPHRLKRISCLSTHSVAVTTTGALLSWGNGDRHRLGHG